MVSATTKNTIAREEYLKLFKINNYSDYLKISRYYRKSNSTPKSRQLLTVFQEHKTLYKMPLQNIIKLIRIAVFNKVSQ